MDLKTYYKNIRDVESRLTTPFLVLYSLDTPEGGKSGRTAEVERLVAARLITEGRCRVASPEEAAAFYREQKDARREAEAIESAQRMHVVVMPQPDVQPKRGKE